MATTRIKLDDRGKGILDLFQNNMGQLGFDLGTIKNGYIDNGVARTGANRYFYDTESYDFKYLFHQGESFVDAPSNIDVQNQALNGFILGQILGGADQTTVIDEIRAEASEATASYFASLVESTEDEALKDLFLERIKYFLNTYI